MKTDKITILNQLPMVSDRKIPRKALRTRILSLMDWTILSTPATPGEFRRLTAHPNSRPTLEI